jgi:peptidylprolyl isomerase domain and WD repeat-containing protein 1
MSGLDEQDVSTLGKRARNNLGDNEEDLSQPNPQKMTEDESDDEVGPMPAPAGASGTTKKKRKGVFRC